jgi:hypothetical protein
MNSIFELDKFEDCNIRIDLDELYEKKQQYDKQQLDIFNKMLAKIHARIKAISRQNINQQYCWYVVPETIIGVPRYNQASCIAYVVDQLKTNGFSVRYIHPNTLYICWKHWIPSYVRNQIKLKTGIVIDEFGKIIENKNNDVEYENGDNLLANLEGSNSVKKRNNGSSNNVGGSDKKYKPINSYKPTGNLIYDDL